MIHTILQVSIVGSNINWNRIKIEHYKIEDPDFILVINIIIILK